MNKTQLKNELSIITQAQADDFNANSSMGDTVWLESWGGGSSYTGEDLAYHVSQLSNSDVFWLQDQTAFALRGKRGSRPC